MRLWRVDLAPLRYDDVDVLSRARDVLWHGPALTGPMTSWGVPDPPGSVYLLLPAALAASSASAGVVLVGLLNVLAVALTYLLTRRFLGPGVALAAGLLFAANPWAVYYSRRSWAEIVPLFTIVALWAAYEVVVQRRARWAVAFFVALAVQVQIRILSLIYGPAALLTLLLWPWRWGVRWPAAGILLGTLLTVPYLSWVGLHWAEVSARLEDGNRGVGLAPRNGAIELVLWSASGFGLLPAVSDIAPWLNPFGQAGRVVLLLVGALLAAGLGMAITAAARRTPGWEARLLPAIWLVLPSLTLIGQSSSVYLHYLVALSPAVFMVMALPLGWLLQGPRRPLAGLGGLLLASLLAYQLTATGLVYRLMEAYEIDEPPTAPPALRVAAVDVPREASELLGTGERYGVEPPIRYWQALADRAIAAAGAAGAPQVWVLAGETDPLTAEAPAVLDYLLRPHVEPRFLPADTLLFRMLRPTVVVELPDLDPIESMERFGERKATVLAPSRNNREGVARARITLVPDRGPQGWASLAPSRLLARFDGPVQFFGYRAEKTVRAGSDLPVTLFWWLTSQSTIPGPVPTLRLVDANGRIFPSESPTRPLPAVEEGDWVVIRREQLAVPSRTPPGQYTLDVVLSTEAGQPIRRADQPAATLPLTTVQVTAR
ncbi:MAG: glycosyltransferase family 39 protein [Chloroflexi bacterium]|nr:glycosyltransferase family 39 protein [Chloroflexota bacterium]